MARPKTPHPTVGELELLQILWENGPSTVRQVLQSLPQERAYTSVMSLLNVMFEKALVTREPALTHSADNLQSLAMLFGAIESSETGAVVRPVSDWDSLISD